MESFIQPGFGLGCIKDENDLLTPRFKIWSGWFFLPTYNLLVKKNNNKHYFRLFGVLSIQIRVGGI